MAVCGTQATLIKFLNEVAYIRSDLFGTLSAVEYEMLSGVGTVCTPALKRVDTNHSCVFLGSKKLRA